jgi:polyisoprenoid-binding protein YceI
MLQPKHGSTQMNTDTNPCFPVCIRVQKIWRWFFLVILLCSIELVLASVSGWLPTLARIAVEQPRSYRIDPARSKLAVNVYKAGFLKAFGHDHLIAVKEYTGEVVVSSNAPDQASVRLEFVTDSFTVLDPDLKPDDRAKVQKDMKSEKVLDVAKYPKITFVSTRVSDVKPVADGLQLNLTGDVTLHGIKRQVTVPVLVTLTDELLRARGEYTLKQTDYQIKPISVVGVRVKDELKIVFDLTASRQS